MCVCCRLTFFLVPSPKRQKTSLSCSFSRALPISRSRSRDPSSGRGYHMRDHHQDNDSLNDQHHQDHHQQHLDDDEDEESDENWGTSTDNNWTDYDQDIYMHRNTMRQQQQQQQHHNMVRGGGAGMMGHHGMFSSRDDVNL